VSGNSKSLLMLTKFGHLGKQTGRRRGSGPGRSAKICAFPNFSSCGFL